MATCALVGATEFNETHFLRQRFDCVIAVDAGFASLREIGVEPDLIVGDFDSLGYVPDAAGHVAETPYGEACLEGGAETRSSRDKTATERVVSSDGDGLGSYRGRESRAAARAVLRFPSEKDESDMELAIAAAEERGCDTIVLYGALAARLDHTLANIQLMVGCARRGMRVFGIGRGFAVAVLDGEGTSSLDFAAFDPETLDGGVQGRFFSLFSYGGAAEGVCESGMKYALDDATLRDDITLGLSNEFMGEPVHVGIAQGNALAIFSDGAWDHLAQ